MQMLLVMVVPQNVQLVMHRPATTFTHSGLLDVPLALLIVLVHSIHSVLFQQYVLIHLLQQLIHAMLVIPFVLITQLLVLVVVNMAVAHRIQANASVL